MSSIADPELTKAFQKLQTQVLVTREQVRHAEAEMEALERQTKTNEIIKKAISSLKPDVNCFVGFGRAFVKKDHQNILSMLDSSIKTNQDKTSKMKQAIEYQEKKVKEMENNIREMIQQKKMANKN